MKMNKEYQEVDFLMNESDEFLLNMTEQLKEELKDVKVSEQLIAKTLKAVNDTKASIPPKRNYMKYAVRFIEVVAACFVLVIGYRYISKVGFGGFKSENTKDAESSMQSDGKHADSGEKEYFNTSESASLTDKESPATLDTTEAAPEYKVDITASDETSITVNDSFNFEKETEDTAITLAIQDARLETVDETIIHTYQGETTQDLCSKLLLLFQSEALSLSSDDVTEEWRNLFILSTDNQTAILYKVGMKEYVVAQVYDTTGLKSTTVYYVSDMAQLHQSIDEIIK